MNVEKMVAKNSKYLSSLGMLLLIGLLCGLLVTCKIWLIIKHGRWRLASMQ
jgi:uncharacterized membrane protein YciS (DUF1049 family)